MKAISFLCWWFALALAASDSSSSSSSSSSLSSARSNSSSSISTSSQSSSSREIGRIILNGLGDTVTTSTVSSSSASVSASPSASPSTAVSATVLSSGSVGNSTAGTPTPTPTGKATYVNPWAGNFSSPVPTTGTGSDYALQCQNAYFSFTSINTDYLNVTASTFYITSVIRSTTVYEVHTYYTTSYYTLCDDHPRVITSLPTATSTTTLPPSTTTFLAQGISAVSYPDPNCTVSWDDCKGLWSRYESASSAYAEVSFSSANTVVSLGPGASFWVVEGVTTTFPTPYPPTISLGDEEISRSIPRTASDYIIVTTPPPGGLWLFDGYTMKAGGPPVTIQHPINFTNTPYTPHCRTEKPTCTANQRCQIDGDRVEIFWFPPQTNVSRDMCATAPVGGGVTSRPPTNFTWSPITTGPYAVLPGGTTWFSGNIYVSLNRIGASCEWSGTPVPVGDNHHGEILTMAPSELFSQRAYPITTGSHSGMIDFEPYAYSFNLNDLVSPYPWSAWAGAPECVMSQCSSINGAYNPWIAVPEAIRRLDPAWATCDLALYGLYDPPRALTSVGNIFATLTTGDPKPGPTPGPSPPQSQVDPTNVPPKPSGPNNTDPPPDSDPPNSDPNDPPNDPPSPPNNPPNNPSSNPNPNNPNNPNNPPQNNPPQNNPPQNNPPQNNPPAPGQTAAPLPPAPTTIATIGSTPIVVNPSNPTQIGVGTTFIAPGAPGLTVGSGTSISMVDPGHIIVSAPGAPAPSTINIPQPNAATPTQGVVITLPNGEQVTATAIIGQGQNGPQTSIVVSGTMFSEGGPPITLPNGVVLSEAPSGTGIIVIDPSTGATSTLPFSSIPGIGDPAPTPKPTPGAVVTIGGKAYTVISQSGSLIIPELGMTLTEGGPASTVDGTVISDAGTGIVVGTTTAPFSTVTVGGTDPAQFTGAAARLRTALGKEWWKAWCWVGSWTGLMVIMGGGIMIL